MTALESILAYGSELCAKSAQLTNRITAKLNRLPIDCPEDLLSELAALFHSIDPHETSGHSFRKSAEIIAQKYRTLAETAGKIYVQLKLSRDNLYACCKALEQMYDEFLPLYRSLIEHIDYAEKQLGTIREDFLQEALRRRIDTLKQHRSTALQTLRSVELLHDSSAKLAAHIDSALLVSLPALRNALIELYQSQREKITADSLKKTAEILAKSKAELAALQEEWRRQSEK